MSSCSPTASHFFASQGSSGTAMRLRPTKSARGVSAPPPRESPRAASRSARGRSPRPRAARRPQAFPAARRRQHAANRRCQCSRIAGGTSRPFSSSCTTSGTPPTAVATTGVPTASASTAACGRFSQALERTAARAPARYRSTSSRGREPAAVHAVVEFRSGRGARAPALRAVADDEQPASGTSASASRATGSPFWRCEPADEDKRAWLQRLGHRRGRRRRVDEHLDRGRDPSRARCRRGSGSARRAGARGRARGCAAGATPRAVRPARAGTPRACRGTGRSARRARRPGRRRAWRRAAGRRRGAPRPRRSRSRRRRRPASRAARPLAATSG